MILAALLFLTLFLSGPGYQAEWISLGTAFNLLINGVQIALAIALISLVSLVLTRIKNKYFSVKALVAILLTVIPSLFVINMRVQANQVPPIHDISTDLDTPPKFVDILPLRKDAPNPAEYLGGEIIQQQKLAYPDLKSYQTALNKEQAFEKMLSVINTKSWELVASDLEAGRIEATDTTLWFGFKDDVVIRISPNSTGSLIDIRSKSRVGTSDLGVNAKRISHLLKDFSDIE